MSSGSIAVPERSPHRSESPCAGPVMSINIVELMVQCRAQTTWRSLWLLDQHRKYKDLNLHLASPVPWTVIVM